MTGATLYNSLPPHIKDSKTVRSFKKTCEGNFPIKKY